MLVGEIERINIRDEREKTEKTAGQKTQIGVRKGNNVACTHTYTIVCIYIHTWIH